MMRVLPMESVQPRRVGVFVVFDAQQFVDDEGIEFPFMLPQHHQREHLEIVRIERRRAEFQGAVDEGFSQRLVDGAVAL